MQQEFIDFGALEKIKTILNEYTPHHIFLVIGKKSFTLSGAKERILPQLKDIPITIFDTFSENPTLNEIKQGIIQFKKSNPDLLICIGGGSVIDTAKAINILSAQKDIPDVYVFGKKKLQQPGKPLIAIPTTAGTGSEATHFATLYHNKTKYSLGDIHLTIPSVAIIDPSLIASAPQRVAASTGLDALCQGIESLWAVNSTEESRKYAFAAIQLAFEAIEEVVLSPSPEKRLQIAQAAHLSGKAINISKTTACHSISYPITSYFNVPHGHAVSLTMPSFLVFNAEVDEKNCLDERGVCFVQQRISEVLQLLKSTTPAEGKQIFTDMMQHIGMETRLHNLNITKQDIGLVLKNGFTKNRMVNNPRKVTEKDLLTILTDIQ